MPKYDERAELAPRDIVARSIVAEMRRTGTRNVFLDMTALSEEFLKHRFPKIYETCAAHGLDIAADKLPVSPASHYCMGGVRTDLWGRTTVPGLYAAGEVTCTGVHGANRLASNSLLEGLVWGARAGEAAVNDDLGSRISDSKFQNPDLKFQISNFKAGKSSDADPNADSRGPRSGFLDPEYGSQNPEPGISTAVKKRVKRIMWERVGILRDRASLERALRELAQISSARLSPSSRSFVTLATLVAAGALWREESRGGHYRTDFPEQDERFRVHSIQKLGAEITTSPQINF
jgi:L-aspartate oxidase